MNINEIRRIKVVELINRFKTQADFADFIDKSPSFVSQFKKGKEAVIGNKVARDIEDKFGLPNGWLDVIDGQSTNSVRCFILVKGTAQMDNDGFWQQIKASDEDGYLEVQKASVTSYAIRAVGQSMFPAIRSGWYVIFDPDKEPVSGEYVHVAFKDGRNTIKEYVSCQNGILNLISVNGSDRLSLDMEEVESVNAFLEIQPPSRLLSKADVNNLNDNKE